MLKLNNQTTVTAKARNLKWLYKNQEVDYAYDSFSMSYTFIFISYLVIIMIGHIPVSAVTFACKTAFMSIKSTLTCFTFFTLQMLANWTF